MFLGWPLPPSGDRWNHDNQSRTVKLQKRAQQNRTEQNRTTKLKNRAEKDQNIKATVSEQ
jgi:hypothetical protein